MIVGEVTLFWAPTVAVDDGADADLLGDASLLFVGVTGAGIFCVEACCGCVSCFVTVTGLPFSVI